MKRNDSAGLFLGLFLLIGFLGIQGGDAWSESAARGARATPSSKTAHSDPGTSADALGAKLQAFLMEAKKQLGNLEPWQNQIFDDEVLSEYKRFIRDYKASPTGVEAEADLDALRKFLRFYAPKSLKRESPSLAVYLKHQGDCAKCAAALPGIRKIVAERLEHRGLIPIWLTAQDLPNPGLSGKELGDALKTVASQKKAVGALVVEWKVAPVDDIDTAHADETHYLIRSDLTIRDVSDYEEQLDLMDTGSFERSESKLLTDAFTDIGEKMERLEISHSELNRDEIQVEVAGFEGFRQYSGVREAIRNALKNSASVEEQKIARGKAVLLVFTEAPVQQVQSVLSSLKVEGVSLSSVTAEGQTIHVGLTPFGQGSEPAKSKGAR